MKAFIFCGGEVFPQYINEDREDGDLVIAADSGYKNARALDFPIDILVGDFDSLGDIPDGVGEVVRLPQEKDMTDTQYAVELAIKRGATEFVIVASTSGRFDHAISLTAILEDLNARKIRAYIVNGQNRINFIRNSGHIVIRDPNFKYFSLIAASEVVKGVSVEGAKYPLKNKTLTRRSQFAVSNEIVKNAALITVKKGGVYIIESRDI